MNSILITGASGLVGYALQRITPQAIFVGSKDFDLTSNVEVHNMFKEYSPTHVIHLAARVGGIKANMDNLGDFYRDNILMNTNVLECAHHYGVKKVLSVLSTCVYPDKAVYPLTEDQIHNGPPHPSNYAYAYSKRMLDVQSRAYRDQYGCNFITAVPNNLFGENDNYHLEHAHVIPAIIHKMYQAKLSRTDVELWGDGSPLREFTYSLDVARILLGLLKDYNERGPINIGNTEEISIRSLANKIKDKIGFEGKINWKTDMPSGQYRKPSDNSLFRNNSPTFEYTDFDEALTNACNWFIMNYPTLRGVK